MADETQFTPPIETPSDERREAPTPNSAQADKEAVAKRTVDHFIERKKQTDAASKDVLKGLLDVYTTLYKEGAPVEASEQPTDINQVKQAVDGVFEDEDNPQVKIVKAKDAAAKIRAYDKKLSKDVHEVQDQIDAPEKYTSQLEDQLSAKKQERDQIQGGFLSKILAGRKLDAEINQLEATLKKAYEERNSSEGSVKSAELSSKKDDLEDEKREIPQIAGSLKDTCTPALAEASVGEYDALLKELGESQEVQDMLFDHALETIITPKVQALITRGLFNPDWAQYYIRLLQAQYQTHKNPEGQFLNDQDKEHLKSIPNQVPGLREVALITEAIQNKDYVAIFDTCFKQNAVGNLQELPQEITTLGLDSNTANDLGIDVVQVTREITARVADIHVLWFNFPPGAKMLWQSVRSSPLAQVIDESSWTSIEKEAVDVAFTRTEIRAAENLDDVEYFNSLIAQNPSLRATYIPRIIPIVGNQMRGSAESRIPGNRMHAALASVTDEELSAFSEKGFDFSTLRDLVLDHPQTFDLYFANPADRQAIKPNEIFIQTRLAVAQLGERILQEPPVSSRDYEFAILAIQSAWNQKYGYNEDYAAFLESGQPIDPQDARWLQYMLRRNDPLLQSIPLDKRMPLTETRQAFVTGLDSLKGILAQDLPDGKKRFLTSKSVLCAISRQPEKLEHITELVLRNPHFDKLQELMTGDGPLAFAVDATLEEIFSSGKPEEFVATIIEDFNKKKPYWETMFDIAKRTYGESLRDSPSGYPISETLIGNDVVSLTSLVQEHTRQKGENPELATRLEELIADATELRKLVEGQASSVPFASLHGMAKEKAFRLYLQRAIELSRDEEAKKTADARNRTLAQKPLEVNNLYVHGTAVDNLSAVLLNGNLPREALGVDAAIKSFPFLADFIRFDQKPGETKNLGEMITDHGQLLVYGSGERHGGNFGNSGQVFLLYDRTVASYQQGVDYNAGPLG